MDLKGRLVQFAIRDIYLPGPDVVLQELYGGEVIAGRIVDVSDSGTDPNAFVVVKVEGIESPVVVPAGRIRQCAARPEPE